MGKLIATRVNDEVYAKILSKCSGLSCSTYDYLKMLVESDVADKKTGGKEEVTKVDGRRGGTGKETDRGFSGQ